MSRSGYSDGYDIEHWSHIRWRGAVASAMRGKRGQAFLRDAIAALDAMPVKELAGGSFTTEDGCRCFLAAVAHQRDIDLSPVLPDFVDDDDDLSAQEVAADVAALLGIAPAMAQEIIYENDECMAPYKGMHPKGAARNAPLTRRERWEAMRRWAISQLKGDLR